MKILKILKNDADPWPGQVACQGACVAGLQAGSNNYPTGI